MLPPNGWLGGHYDAEYHPLYNWKRIGSLVWFANIKWEESWGGQLIVGDIKILPKFNTAVSPSFAKVSPFAFSKDIESTF